MYHIYILSEFNICPLSEDRQSQEMVTILLAANCRLAEISVTVELLCVKALVVGERRLHLRWFLCKITSDYFVSFIN